MWDWFPGSWDHALSQGLTLNPWATQASLLNVFSHVLVDPLYIFLGEMSMHVLCHFFFFFLIIYLLVRETEREAETQAKGEAGSTQGARCGTWSRVSRITPWTEGGTKPLSHPGCPSLPFLNGLIWFLLLNFMSYVLYSDPLEDKWFINAFLPVCR